MHDEFGNSRGTGSDFMDADVLDAHLDSVSRGEACDVNHFDSAFTNAFLKTDEEFGKVRLAAQQIDHFVLPSHAARVEGRVQSRCS